MSMFTLKEAIHFQKFQIYTSFMNILRVGIIGCGVIAPTHIWAIEENEGIELTALCDINRSRMEKIHQSKNCIHFEDWKEMLQSPGVDIVAICLPHYLHEQAIIDALQAGKHVISEKPLAVNLNQIQNIKKIAAEAELEGIHSFGIFQHRYSPLICEIQSVLKEKSLGTLIDAKVNFICTRKQSYYNSDLWRGLWETEGGGTLINQGIHTLDILYQLLGLPHEVEYSLTREKLKEIEVEDKGVGSLSYDTSIVSSGKVSLHFENDLKTGWMPEIILIGTKGTLEVQDSEHFSCNIKGICRRLEKFLIYDEDKAPGKECYGSLHSRNYKDIINSLSEKQKGNRHQPKVSLFDLASTTETVLALYQSHFQRKRINLPLISWKKPQKLAYTGAINE